MKKLAAIQILRAVAALLVVVSHAILRQAEQFAKVFYLIRVFVYNQQEVRAVFDVFPHLVLPPLVRGIDQSQSAMR